MFFRIKNIHGILAYLLVLILIQVSGRFFYKSGFIVFNSYAQQAFHIRIIIAFIINLIIGCFIWSLSNIICFMKNKKICNNIVEIYFYIFFASLFSFIASIFCLGYDWTMTTF